MSVDALPVAPAENAAPRADRRRDRVGPSVHAADRARTAFDAAMTRARGSAPERGTRGRPAAHRDDHADRELSRPATDPTPAGTTTAPPAGDDQPVQPTADPAVDASAAQQAATVAPAVVPPTTAPGTAAPTTAAAPGSATTVVEPTTDPAMPVTTPAPGAASTSGTTTGQGSPATPPTDAAGATSAAPATAAGRTGDDAGTDGNAAGTPDDRRAATTAPATSGTTAGTPTDATDATVVDGAASTTSDSTTTAGVVAAGTATTVDAPQAPPAGVPAVVLPSVTAPAPVAATEAALAGRPAQLPTPAAQIAPHVVALRSQPDGTHHMTLHLHPEDIGAVQVSVEITGRTVNVSLSGADEQARGLLRDGLDDLRRELAGAGLDAGRLDVGTQSGNRRDPQTAGDGGRTPQGDSRRSESGRDHHGSDRTDPHHRDVVRFAHQRGSVDVTV